MNKTSSTLTKAIAKIMRPLVKLLLNQGIAFDALSDQLKVLYVDVAQRDFSIAGKKQTISRISTITGLSRKEVKKAMSMNELNLDLVSQQYNRAARVISGWIRDKQFLDKKGSPIELDIEKGDISFSVLVKRYSGDIPPRAIADELIRVGAIKCLKNGKIKLIKRAYIPEKNIDEKLYILGSDVSDLIETIYHNIFLEKSDAFFQRKVSYDAIPESFLEQVKEIINKGAQTCLEDLDKKIVKYDSDLNKNLNKIGRCRAGLGIFYFQEEKKDE